MDALDRNITVARGARFFRSDAGEVMFEFVLDPTNRIGPREATAKDRANHAEAYRAFSSADLTEAQAEAPESPATLPQVEEIAGRGPFNGADPAKFDHDHDGKPGGSLPEADAEAGGQPVESPAEPPVIATADLVAPRQRARRSRKG